MHLFITWHEFIIHTYFLFWFVHSTDTKRLKRLGRTFQFKQLQYYRLCLLLSSDNLLRLRDRERRTKNHFNYKLKHFVCKNSMHTVTFRVSSVQWMPLKSLEIRKAVEFLRRQFSFWNRSEKNQPTEVRTHYVALRKLVNSSFSQITGQEVRCTQQVGFFWELISFALVLNQLSKQKCWSFYFFYRETFTVYRVFFYSLVLSSDIWKIVFVFFSHSFSFVI